MNVHIKKLNIDMDLGSNGLTLGVADTKGKHTGNLKLGKAKITWFSGKTRKNGVTVDWDELTEWFESRV